jgi:hypothetical protein
MRMLRVGLRLSASAMCLGMVTIRIWNVFDDHLLERREPYILMNAIFSPSKRTILLPLILASVYIFCRALQDTSKLPPSDDPIPGLSASLPKYRPVLRKWKTYLGVTASLVETRGRRPCSEMMTFLARCAAKRRTSSTSLLRSSSPSTFHCSTSRMLYACDTVYQEEGSRESSIDRRLRSKILTTSRSR